MEKRETTKHMQVIGPQGPGLDSIAIIPSAGGNKRDEIIQKK